MFGWDLASEVAGGNAKNRRRLRRQPQQPTARLEKQPSAEGLGVKGRALGEADHTEADTVEEVAGLEAVTVRQVAVPGVVLLGAAAQQLHDPPAFRVDQLHRAGWGRDGAAGWCGGPGRGQRPNQQRPGLPLQAAAAPPQIVVAHPHSAWPHHKTHEAGAIAAASPLSGSG